MMQSAAGRAGISSHLFAVIAAHGSLSTHYTRLFSQVADGEVALNLESLLVPTAVSLVVTLGIEYAAKPRLEARKERILEAVRTRRELLARLAVIGMAATAAAMEMPAGVSEAVLKKLRAERARQFERLEAEVRQLVDDAGRYLATFTGPARALVADYLFVQLGVLLSGRSRSEQCARVLELTKQMAVVLDGPRWRFWVRLKAWFALSRTLAGLQTIDEPAA
ncbi:hypothetical protein [Microbispora sp. NPDC049125]|uniref:hypothetical protein n=1 Tax=Microbispora sp. NPDC049125 TaxID=3154929 RepID=UPI00346712B3